MTMFSKGAGGAVARLTVLGLGAGLLAGPVAAAEHGVGSLRLIGEQEMPVTALFADTPVGGLSGIDYDAATRTWLLISDDRSAKAPARFYTARLDIDADKVGPLHFDSVVTLAQPDGTPFPKAGGEVPDPEAIRFDGETGMIWWTSEGDRKLGLPPTARQATLAGRSQAPLPTPPMFAAHPDTESGTRDNLGFEGLSLSPDAATLWLAIEAPTYADGPLPTPAAGALSRIVHLDRQGKVLAQYAYPLDPIPAKPGEGKAADNGVTEILAVDDTHLLAVERAGVQAADGSYADYIRVYETDLGDATDVNGIAALAGADLKPLRKRLVLDLNTLGLARLDNIEGIAWGPKLANGHDTLVMISDNNFNPAQVTQLLAFEALP